MDGYDEWRQKPTRKQPCHFHLPDHGTAVETAFQEVGVPEYLATQAEKNPQAFMSVLGRLLPSGSALNVAVGIQVEGEKESFEQILGRAIIIDGGFPDFEAKKQRDIGELFQRYQRGETLPDPIVIGGLYDDIFVDAIQE